MKILPCSVRLLTMKQINKTHRIYIRCSESDCQKIKLNAELSQLSVSQYMLSLALKNPIKTQADHEIISSLLAMKADMARLGNLFKLCVDTGQVNSDLFNSTLTDIHNLSLRIGVLIEERLK